MTRVHFSQAQSVQRNMPDIRGDDRLKTTTSVVGHRLHAWEENRMRRGATRIISGRPRWANNTRSQPKLRFPRDPRPGPGNGVSPCFLCALPTRYASPSLSDSVSLSLGVPNSLGELPRHLAILVTVAMSELHGLLG